RIGSKPDIYINVIQELHGIRAVGESGVLVKARGHRLVEKTRFLTGKKYSRQPGDQQCGKDKFFHQFTVLNVRGFLLFWLGYGKIVYVLKPIIVKRNFSGMEKRALITTIGG